MSTPRYALAATLGLLLTLCLAAPALAQNYRRGLIYAPLYHEAVVDHRGRRLDLSATVYVRNLNQKQAITVESVTLVSGQGKAGAPCVEGAKRLVPLATLRLLPGRCPAGSGEPSLLIRWSAEQPVRPPMVEVLMMGTAGQQGISLTSQGVPLEQEP